MYNYVLWLLWCWLCHKRTGCQHSEGHKVMGCYWLIYVESTLPLQVYVVQTVKDTFCLGTYYSVQNVSIYSQETWTSTWLLMHQLSCGTDAKQSSIATRRVSLATRNTSNALITAERCSIFFTAFSYVRSPNSESYLLSPSSILEPSAHWAVGVKALLHHLHHCIHKLPFLFLTVTADATNLPYWDTVAFQFFDGLLFPLSSC